MASKHFFGSCAEAIEFQRDAETRDLNTQANQQQCCAFSWYYNTKHLPVLPRVRELGFGALHILRFRRR